MAATPPDHDDEPPQTDDSKPPQPSDPPQPNNPPQPDASQPQPDDKPPETEVADTKDDVALDATEQKPQQEPESNLEPESESKQPQTVDDSQASNTATNDSKKDKTNKENKENKGNHNETIPQEEETKIEVTKPPPKEPTPETTSEFEKALEASDKDFLSHRLQSVAEAFYIRKNFPQIVEMRNKLNAAIECTDIVEMQYWYLTAINVGATLPLELMEQARVCHINISIFFQ